MNYTYNIENLTQIAKYIITHSKSKVLLFYGVMGVGKTTLIKKIAKELGVNSTTNSPSFSLVNEYVSQTGDSIFHFDFYRIKSEKEAYDMGIEEYLDSGKWCLIEWPEKIQSILPEKYTKVKISQTNNHQRSLEINEYG